tara:strand:- start:342 stop:902 length:561 start_codon:yes stop_codon:yes gene_type:complete
MPKINMMSVNRSLPVFKVIVDDHENLNKHLLDLVKEYRDKYPEKETHTNLRAWRSSYDTHINEDRFNFLIDQACELATVVSRSYFQQDEKLDEKYLPSAFWVAQFDEGNYARNHHHYPNDWAVTYYIDVDENSAPIVFEDELTVQPENGLMVIWPGFLKHRVPHTTSSRTVAAMNLVKKLDIIEVD